MPRKKQTEQTPEAAPQVDDNGKPLVENINTPEDDEAQTEELGKPVGADNISDEQADLREDLKSDSLGGSPQVPEPTPDDAGTASG